MTSGLEQMRLRCEYVQKKRSLYGTLALSGLGAMLAFAAICWTCQRAFTTPDFIRSNANGGVFFNVLAVGIILYILALFIVILWYSVTKILVRAQEVRRLPYIGPVTIDTLAPAEILVRGSQEHGEPGTQLLRAPFHSVATPSTQLLRIAMPDPGELRPSLQEGTQT